MEDWGLNRGGAWVSPAPPGEWKGYLGKEQCSGVTMVQRQKCSSWTPAPCRLPGQDSPAGPCWAGHWASEKPLKGPLKRHLRSRGLRVGAEQPRESAGRTGVWL